MRSRRYLLSLPISNLLFLVVVRVLRPQVGEEVAGEHPIETMEEGEEADLKVNLLDFRQIFDALGPML